MGGWPGGRNSVALDRSDRAWITPLISLLCLAAMALLGTASALHAPSHADVVAGNDTFEDGSWRDTWNVEEQQSDAEAEVVPLDDGSDNHVLEIRTGPTYSSDMRISRPLSGELSETTRFSTFAAASADGQNHGYALRSADGGGARITKTAFGDIVYKTDQMSDPKTLVPDGDAQPDRWYEYTILADPSGEVSFFVEELETGTTFSETNVPFTPDIDKVVVYDPDYHGHNEAWFDNVGVTLPEGEEGPIWPSYRGSATREASADPEAGSPAGPTWSYAAKDEATFQMPPVPSNDGVYALTCGGSEANRIVKIDETSGEREWRSDVRIDTTVSSVGHGAVFLVDDRNLTAIDEDTGGTLWQRGFDGTSFAGGPTLHADRLYASTEDGRVHSFDPSTGELLRSTQLTTEGRLFSLSLAADDGTVWLTSVQDIHGDPQGELYALDAGTLQVEWSTAVDDGLLSPAVGPTGVYVMGFSGTVYGVDRDDGELRWNVEASTAEYDMPRMVVPPVVSDGTVYVATNDGEDEQTGGATYVAIDASTGQEEWRREFWTGERRSVSPGPPALTDATLYTVQWRGGPEAFEEDGDTDPWLVGLDAGGGEVTVERELTNTDVTEEPPRCIEGPPLGVSVRGDQLYATTLGQLHAFSLGEATNASTDQFRSGEAQDGAWTQHQRSPQNHGVAPAGTPVVEAGWSAELGRVEGLAADGDHIYAALSDYDAQDRLVALEPPSREPVWSYELDAPDHVLVAGGLVLATDNQGRVHAVDAGSGTHRWTTEGIGTPTVHPVIAGSTMVTGAAPYDDPGVINVVDLETGARAWQEEGVPVHGLGERGGTVYVVWAKDGIVASLDPATRDWGPSASIEDRPTQVESQPAVGPDHVYIGTKDGIVAVDRTSGETAWASNVGETWPPTLGSDGLYAPVFEGEEATGENQELSKILRLDPSGRAQTVWTEEEPTWDQVAATALGAGRLVVSTFDQVTILDADTGEVLATHETSYPTADPVLADSTIYLGTTDGLQAYALGADAEDPGSTDASGLRAEFVDVPERVDAGETIEIKVRARNAEQQADRGHLTLGFPALDGGVTVSSTSMPESTTLTTGDDIWAGYGSYRTTAEHAVAEAAAQPWPAGATDTLTVEVTPEEPGTFPVQLKTTRVEDGTFTSDPPKQGSSTSTLDHQDEQVKERSIEVEAGGEDNWKLELAKRFRPVLVFHPDEVYRPMPAEYALDHSDLRAGDGSLIAEHELDSADLPVGGSSDRYLDDPRIDVEATGSDENAVSVYHSSAGEYEETVYARIDEVEVTHETDLPYGSNAIDLERATVIQYWIYYPYNDWINEHEGEWEMVQVNLPGPIDEERARGGDLRPFSVYYSAHHGGYALDWDKRPVWQTSEPWLQEELPREATGGGIVQSPMAFVAEGSHASYPHPNFARWENIAKGEPLYDYQVRLIDQGTPPWTYFPGMWGEEPATPDWIENPGPPGPMFSEAQAFLSDRAVNKWAEPLRWTEPVSKGKIFLKQSGSDAIITDSEGRRTGYEDGEIVNEIPDAMVLDVVKTSVDSEIELYYLPDGDTYTATIDGYTDAETDVSVTDLQGRQAHVTEFQNLNVSPSYQALLEFGEDHRSTELREDTDGDGSFERTVEPTSQGTVSLAATGESSGGLPVSTILQVGFLVVFVAAGVGLAGWMARRQG